MVGSDRERGEESEGGREYNTIYNKANNNDNKQKSPPYPLITRPTPTGVLNSRSFLRDESNSIPFDASVPV